MDDIPRTNMQERGLAITYQGKLFKYSQKTNEWEDRWGFIIYGIFTYFSNQQKCNLFERYLHDSTKHATIRERFRGALNHHPPRGYIKVLNGQGQCVSQVQIDEQDNSFKILRDARFFHLRAPDESCLCKWKEAFENMSIQVRPASSDTPAIVGWETAKTPMRTSFNDDQSSVGSNPSEDSDRFPSNSHCSPRKASIELDRLDKQLEEQIFTLKREMSEEDDNNPGSFLKNLTSLTQRWTASNLGDDENDENIEPPSRSQNGTKATSSQNAVSSDFDDPIC